MPDNRDIEIVLVFGFSKRAPLNISGRMYKTSYGLRFSVSIQTNGTSNMFFEIF